MNDDELKNHMMHLAKREIRVVKARCLGTHCSRIDDQEQRQKELNMMVDELARMRKDIHGMKAERDALNAILSRLVEENVALEARLPLNTVRRWIRLLRGEWRV